jgi:hypothetical protein
VTAGLGYGSTDAQGFTEAGGYNSDYLTRAYFASVFGFPSPGPLTIVPNAAAEGVKAEESAVSFLCVILLAGRLRTPQDD